MYLKDLNLTIGIAMADSNYNEDKKFILESLSELKNSVKTLFENDNDIKVALATINTKLMLVSAGASAIVGIVVAIVMKFIGLK
jgi:hypothetical protein